MNYEFILFFEHGNPKNVAIKKIFISEEDIRFWFFFKTLVCVIYI